jgi:two-component system, sensor histidine kinase
LVHDEFFMGATSGKRMPKRRISIATRLYFVVGIMGLLIVLELLTLRFAMQKLSAVRAFVGGEALWSKAQKNAVFSLQRYASTHDPKDFQQFLNFLSIPEGDHIARMELMKPEPDLKVVRKGFLQGRIHPDDIDPMINLLRQFYWVSQLDRAIQAWKAADQRLEELVGAGKEFQVAITAGQKKTAAAIMDHIKFLNEELTVLEEEFSLALGEGSRFLETLVLTLLTIAVITVESVGLGLAFFTARGISRGLDELNQAAHKIGHGRFDTKVEARSNDELGELAEAVSLMGEMLKKSYGQLEARVEERTQELAKLAGENARLYNDASLALKRRDEFLSLASHELKTPITSLLLQAQMLLRGTGGPPSPDQLKKLASFFERQLIRLNDLVEEMLDTSRIDLSKLALRIEPHNLSELVREVSTRLEPQFAAVRSPLALEIDDNVRGQFDSHRIEQVITNLLTNALKYAPGTKITIKLENSGENMRLSVQDEGPGVRADDEERIFGRFERGVAPGRVSGLGIGLFIVRAIVTAHQGRIFLEKSGKGAKFVMDLPRTPS